MVGCGKRNHAQRQDVLTRLDHTTGRVVRLTTHTRESSKAMSAVWILPRYWSRGAVAMKGAYV